MKTEDEPADARALIAIDLGGESCRVSLLRWHDGVPQIEIVRRFANAPRQTGDSLRWDWEAIETGVNQGLRDCAARAPEGVASVGVDGWAVDYVRLNNEGVRIDDPFCYRDERTIEAERFLHGQIAPERLRAITGVQLLRINTLYQLVADRMAGMQKGCSWQNLPEYLLSRLGGEVVSEFTNATHTQLLDVETQEWSGEIFAAAQIDLSSTPRLVPAGTQVGTLRGPLAELPAFQDTALIAPACHDTASAIAGIAATGKDWGYISSGTWSLVGTLLDKPNNSAESAKGNFTNLGAAGGKVCFHKGVNGMWLLKQCMDEWAAAGQPWSVAELTDAAEVVGPPDGMIDLDDPSLLLHGHMLGRINAQRSRQQLPPLDISPENAPQFASLFFHSLATKYAQIFRRVETLTGKHLKRIYVVGGASRNRFLNRLTAEKTGVEVACGAPESSTLGNFAVQLASRPQTGNLTQRLRADDASHWAGRLQYSIHED